MRPLLPHALLLAGVGAAVLALELLLPRILAPHAGTSAEVWSATFAVVLLSTALGNAWGGRLAARPGGGRRGEEGALLLLGAAALAVPALLGTRLGRAVDGWSPLARALGMGLALAGPAFVALGAVATRVTNRALEASSAPGRALGRLSAASAVGCLFGAYLAGFLLIPRWPTTVGIGLIAGALVLAALLRSRVTRPPSPAAAPSPPPRAAPHPLSLRPGLALAALVGGALFFVEIVAARTASRLVGDGIYTWTAVLAAVLLGWAVGSAFGGRLADRGDPVERLGTLLLFASVLVALTAWTPALLPPLVAAPGPTLPWRIALAAVLAWTPAAAALGALAPIVVRAVLRGEARDARRVGWTYAASTTGSALVCLCANALVVPVLGTAGTLLGTALLLALARPLARSRLELPWSIALAAAFLCAALPLEAARTVGARLALRDDADAVFSTDSRYGRIRVDVPREAADLARPRVRRLVIDGFVHGWTDLDDPDWLGYGYEGVYAAVTDRLAPADAAPPRALFVGGGACTFPRWLARHRPGASIDVVEIDPAVSHAAQVALGLEDPPAFRLTHEDARTFVRRLPADAPRYDLVYADAFDDLSVPWHLATTEFVEEVASHLAPDGALVWNVVDAAWSGRFLGALVATLRRTFPEVVVLGPPTPGPAQETFVLVASRAPLPLEGLRRAAARTREGGDLAVRRWPEAEVEALVRAADGRVLRDDHAPVETLLAPIVGRRERR